ncbi:ATP synthase subunit I [Ramlibacter sp. MAHUQ-53]|uniref:ATP synthase subunit I n=1 Tax=unclassified Ramlibacter TaxID=2617605 RepID=UPI00362B2936
MRGSQTNKIAPALPEDLQDSPIEEAPVTPLTAEQANELRGRISQVSPWAVVGAQVGVGLLAALAAGAWFGNAAIGWSLGYGALAVAVPAGVFARALRRGAGAMILLWEWVKLGLTVALLLAAPRLVPGLNWLALLAGVALATKMYWVALVIARRPRRNGN